MGLGPMSLGGGAIVCNDAGTTASFNGWKTVALAPTRDLKDLELVRDWATVLTVCRSRTERRFVVGKEQWNDVE